MTKPKYLALEDLQALWSDKLKPWINGQKADKTSTYTKTEVDTKIEGAQLSNMFRLYVDPTDMHLKGQPCSQGTMEVIDGHLILHTE